MTRHFAVIVSMLLLCSPALAGKRHKAAPKGGKVVAVETNHGTIEITLYPKKAPKSVANFLAYVRSGHYNGTIFHRVISNFMIQGGGMTPNMSKKPTRKPVENEAFNGLKNSRGTVAMARTPNPHSATAQFFINVKNNSFLNFKSRSPRGWGYCVFGKVSKGMKVVDAIRNVATGRRNGRANVPVKTVLIKKVRVLR